MKSTVLNGVWKLSGKKEAGGPVRIFSDGEINIESTVPGNIELDLFHAGIIDDPYIRLNAGALRKYEFYEWCFTRDFEYELGPGNVELVCDGLDCYAAIFINGQLAGEPDRKAEHPRDGAGDPGDPGKAPRNEPGADPADDGGGGQDRRIQPGVLQPPVYAHCPSVPPAAAGDVRALLAV